MEVKTYKLINGLFQPRNPDDHARFSGEQRVVFAADYEALAAELDECIANCADPKDKHRIRELEAVLRLIADAKDVRGCGEIARKVLAGATGFVVSDGRTVKFNEATPDRGVEP
jgi:hypothetical protein